MCCVLQPRELVQGSCGAVTRLVLEADPAGRTPTLVRLVRLEAFPQAVPAAWLRVDEADGNTLLINYEVLRNQEEDIELQHQHQR